MTIRNSPAQTSAKVNSRPVVEILREMQFAGPLQEKALRALATSMGRMGDISYQILTAGDVEALRRKGLVDERGIMPTSVKDAVRSMVRETEPHSGDFVLVPPGKSEAGMATIRNLLADVPSMPRIARLG